MEQVVRIINQKKIQRNHAFQLVVPSVGILIFLLGNCKVLPISAHYMKILDPLNIFKESCTSAF